MLTLALLVPLTAGDYDLSVAATMDALAMTLAILNVNHGWSIWASIAAALGVGFVVGIINGALVVLLERRLADRDARHVDVHRRA